MPGAVLVPNEGPIERHADGMPFALLDERGAEGPAVQLSLSNENDGRFLCFRLAEAPPQNNRARTMLARLTGVHFQITGPAIFVGLSDEEITTMMEQT